jgi:hypothetical protein
MRRPDANEDGGVLDGARAKAFHDHKEWLDLIDHRLQSASAEQGGAKPP